MTTDTYSDCNECRRPLENNECPVCDGDARYRIVRMFRDGGYQRVVKTGLSLREAKAWCRDPETSSSTATSKEAVLRTRVHGPWFDGWDPQ